MRITSDRAFALLLAAMLSAAALLPLPAMPAAGACPARVVSLAPSLPEMAYTVGAGECLVGVVAYSDYPPQARSLPGIGDAFRFDLERIVGLGATDALLWTGGTPRAVAGQLESLGIRVHWITVRALDDIPAALDAVAAVAGDAAIAAAAGQAFAARLRYLTASRRDRPPVAVFYQVSRRPLFTLGGPHVITDVIGRCGGRNIFAALNQEAAVVDLEAVLAADPDIILAAAGEEDPLRHWRAFPGLAAVRRGALHTVDPDRLVRPTPRILDGMAELCETLDAIRPATDPGSENDPR